MTSFERLLRSSVGKKAVMAVTGFILVGFVIGHMLGNLQVYLGRDRYNAYAEGLKHMPALVWAVRVLLLTSVFTHIWAAVTLAAQQRRARPIRYQRLTPVQSTYAARTMYWSGPILALFIVYHLLHFTTGQLHPSFEPHDVYHNFVTAFLDWRVSAAYVIAMLALGLHLMHGVSSAFQSLGLSPSTREGMESFALGVTGLIVVGNISMPIAVLLGVVRP
jgi:succinate dehydrogenase / fumarate reductase cytochrome b subunit